MGRARVEPPSGEEEHQRDAPGTGAAGDGSSPPPATYPGADEVFPMGSSPDRELAVGTKGRLTDSRIKLPTGSSPVKQGARKSARVPPRSAAPTLPVSHVGSSRYNAVGPRLPV